ncbi:MAG: hypothetical protein NTY34_07820 [Candidatus Omnitrophica bacterium]|nr:hypothetical protein [Candidatus Omnitrophota bacterium]
MVILRRGLFFIKGLAHPSTLLGMSPELLPKGSGLTLSLPSFDIAQDGPELVEGPKG